MINKGNIILLCIILLNISISFINSIIKTNTYDLDTIHKLELINNRLYYEEIIINYINDNYNELIDDDYYIEDIQISLEKHNDNILIYIYDLDTFITFVINESKVIDYY